MGRSALNGGRFASASMRNLLLRITGLIRICIFPSFWLRANSILGGRFGWGCVSVCAVGLILLCHRAVHGSGALRGSVSVLVLQLIAKPCVPCRHKASPPSLAHSSRRKAAIAQAPLQPPSQPRCSIAKASEVESSGGEGALAPRSLRGGPDDPAPRLSSRRPGHLWYEECLSRAFPVVSVVSADW